MIMDFILTRKRHLIYTGDLDRVMCLTKLSTSESFSVGRLIDSR